jgi:hypothetical protein
VARERKMEGRKEMAKNLCGKTRKKEDPYEIWAANGWEWRVLKKYQADDNKPFARSFCFVTSPYCPEGEYGDTYVKDYNRALRTK